VLVDDHSRLIPFAAYYPQANTEAFHHAFKEAILRRGLREAFPRGFETCPQPFSPLLAQALYCSFFAVCCHFLLYSS
jgi:hypothetical protein